MARSKLISVLCLAFGVVTYAGAADYYVWVDENGVTNYSEQEPKGVNARHVTDAMPFGYATDAADSRRPGRNPEASQSKQADDQSAPASPSAGSPVNPDKLAEEERKKFEQQIADAKEKNCELGKRNLAKLQTYARIRVKGDDGKERVLSDKEKQAKMEEARQIIRDNCTG